MVSGPDYDPNCRWRRVFDDAPLVSPNQFVSGFARRAESQCRMDWAALPIMRSVAYKHTAEHTMTSLAQFPGKRGSAVDTSAADLVKAAKNLYHHLHHGFTGTGVHRVPIAGDTTRLPFATGLTPLQKKLAFAQNFLAKHLPGSQQLRQLMGHTQFGARVGYGDCLFFTISPNELQSALVLLLSRFRPNDPYVRESTEAVQRLAAANYPALEAQGQQAHTDGDDDSVDIEFPEYDLRRLTSARDPLAVVNAYKINIVLRLATVFGVRMCPRCPRCNDGVLGCQDKFGNNLRPVGGVAGAMPALGGATEHQGFGTPHFHGEGHIACAHQFGTLQDIADKIRAGDMSAQDLKDYQSWLHAEDIMHEQTYSEFRPRVEREWEDRYASAEHSRLSTTPQYLVEEARAAAQHGALNVARCSSETDLRAVEQEGAAFTETYRRDAQYVFSRVQHHVHRCTKRGYEPLRV